MTHDAIWFTLPPPLDDDSGAPPPRAGARPIDADDRRQARVGAEGRHASRRVPRGRQGHADALLPRDADAGQRLPRVRRRGRGRAGAGAGLLAQGRSGHEDAHQLAAGADCRARWCSSCWLRRWICPPPTSCRHDSREYGADAGPLRAAAATVAQPVKDDNDLYIRDYSKCVLCYKCVEACGTDAQYTFAIAVAGRGFHAHISTELDVPLPESACVYCGNCIAVCPTGALMAKPEFDAAAGGQVGAGAAERHRHHLPVLRRRLHARPCTSRTTASSKSPRRSTTTSRAATSA